MLSGHVVTGEGEGASFTQVPWARDQFITKLGIDPHPGTLNLLLDSPIDQAHWTELKAEAGYIVAAPDPSWCNARCYPIHIAGWLPGAIIFPEVPNYPEAQVEIISALPLRKKLSLVDGASLSLEINRLLQVRAVLFDVDGTLVDSVEAYRVVAEYAAAPYGIPITDDVVRHALNTNHPNFWDLVVPANRPNRAELIGEIKKEAFRRWPEVLRQYGRLIPGLSQALEVLQGRGLSLGIVTGSRGGSLQPLEDAGLMEFFEVIVTRQNIKQRKPHPEGLLKGVADLGVEPGEAVYVGDSVVDIQAGRAAHMASVAVLSGAGDSALLSIEGPDWIIHTCSHLPEVLE